MGKTGMAYRLKLFLSLLALGVVLAGLAPAGHAAEINRIAAVVNDEAITVLDLQMRVRLAQVTSNIPDTPEVRQRLASQVLRKMIEERLMVQEGKRMKISVTKDEVVKHVALVEKQNRMPEGNLERVLKQAGLPMSVLYRQIEADLSWVKVLRQGMAGHVKISDDEVKDHLEMLQANLGQPEYLLAEIVLPVDVNDREADIVQTAQKIIDQMRHGANFSSVATQFSQSASAARGGDLGWVPVASLEPEVAQVLSRMQPGTLSEPIRTIDGYQIILLRDRRLFGQTSGGSTSDSMIAIAQLYVPAGNDRGAAVRKILEISQGLKNCAQMEEAAKRHNLTQSGRGTADLAKMSAPARKFVSGLKLLQVSSPLQDQNGVRVVMVCGKAAEEPRTESGLPTPEQVKSYLERKRMEMLAQSHLRDLKRSAFIEIKM